MSHAARRLGVSATQVKRHEGGAAKLVREIAGDADFGLRNPVQSAAMLVRILNRAERFLEARRSGKGAV